MNRRGFIGRLGALLAAPALADKALSGGVPEARAEDQIPSSSGDVVLPNNKPLSYVQASGSDLVFLLEGKTYRIPSNPTF